MVQVFELVDHGKDKRATVRRTFEGWRYQEEAGPLVVRDVVFRHWNRAEAALRIFEWRNGADDQSTNR